MQNYSSINAEILGASHSLEVFTNTREFVFNEKKGNYFSEDELEEMTIPGEEVQTLNELIASGTLNSDELMKRIIDHCNWHRDGCGKERLDSRSLWDDLVIEKIAVWKEHRKSCQYYGKVKVSLIGDLEISDPSHGIAITFAGNEIIGTSDNATWDYPHN